MKRSHHTPGGVSVHVKGKNYTITPALRDLVVQKMRKMDKYLDRLDAIEVELTEEKTRSAESQKCVEATTHILGRTIRVSATDDDMLGAIDGAVDKLYRQLNRHKERLKSHHGGRRLPSSEELVDGDASSAANEDGAEPEVLVERIDVTPQFEDEALQQMQLLGRDVYVFLNARSEQINVIYRRADGVLTVIEPRIG